MSTTRDNPRTRPAKAPLGRAAVVAAALALVDEIGFAAVTMRRVAQALDTGPASLYVYVADRDELMALAYDLALAEVELPGPADGDWRARLESLVSRTASALAGHDDLALVALTGVQTGPNALRLTEETLRLLREGGIDDAHCAWAADLLDQHIISSALERAGWLRDQRRQAATEQVMIQEAERELDTVVAALPPGEFPTLHALRGSLTTTGDSAARAEWKLRVIIDGLLSGAG
ncbi:TetR/AcrR family transcriptional regulator C-terminal domain-containing protein [Actinoplanes sp. CA-054009]